jgi:membrane associated rhomboid family serine protease
MQYPFSRSRKCEEDCPILVDIETSSSAPPSNFDVLQDDEDDCLQEVSSHVLQKPIFTMLYTSSVLLLFVYGIYFISGAENVEYGLLSPISPPMERLYFTTASEWPSCEDNRSQWWRLFSHQLVHAGYLHVLSNQLMLLIFGCFYEANQGFWRTFFLFELSIVAGCMGHAAVWPLRSLIGNSHGVYGLFGASLAEVLVNADVMAPKQVLLLLFMFCTQLCIDVLVFFLWFNPHVGYSAHAAGFFSGLLLSFAISTCEIKRVWKYIFSVTSISLFGYGLWQILQYYEKTWPPTALLAPSWSDVSQQTCCADALLYQDDLGISQEEVLDLFTCDGYDLIDK